MFFYSKSNSIKIIPIKHQRLPPFDKSDSWGEVHTTQPPELVIPFDKDLMFIRADFAGLTLDANRWGDAENELKELNIKGANSTPYRMLMSPMLILYPKKWQDAYLTETAERYYTHIVISGDGWNLAANGFDVTTDKMVVWAKYLQSWGLYIIYWRSVPQLNDPILQALVDNHCVDWVIPGEEVDGKITAEQFEAVLDNTLSITGGGIPIGAHFTDNYPEGFPRDTFLTNWDKYDGKVHLMWQANPADSAGKQGAMLYYARQRVNLGLVGGNGRQALKSRAYAYETMAEFELYNKCNEEYCNLRTLELLYTTRNDNRVAAVTGFGNGCRLPSGLWI